MEVDTSNYRPHPQQAELESHLQRRQLPVDGLKGDLIDRLYTHLQAASSSEYPTALVEEPVVEQAIVVEQTVVKNQTVDDDAADAPTSIDDLLAWKKVCAW